MPYITTTQWRLCRICEATFKIFLSINRYVASLELIGKCRDIRSRRSLSPRGPTAASATKLRRCDSKRAHIKRDLQHVLDSTFLWVGERYLAESANFGATMLVLLSTSASLTEVQLYTECPDSYTSMLSCSIFFPYFRFWTPSRGMLRRCVVAARRACIVTHSPTFTHAPASPRSGQQTPQVTMT